MSLFSTYCHGVLLLFVLMYTMIPVRKGRKHPRQRDMHLRNKNTNKTRYSYEDSSRNLTHPFRLSWHTRCGRGRHTSSSTRIRRRRIVALENRSHQRYTRLDQRDRRSAAQHRYPRDTRAGRAALHKYGGGPVADAGFDPRVFDCGREGLLVDSIVVAKGQLELGLDLGVQVDA